ncbi:ribosome biogenesis GTPase YlqF [Effusibacillus lacus]|uniref:Ribosome biogenesis GTPase A n=1 Tax=Effusibacillus lacus TaxID=1348429 RepID=A0A292YRM5_9BACL|nr:ribosome biogenesis GTPase YlqF [Effusibacillus lacus]TCS76059.1 Ras superfamily GTP-binding protein YlqF [Effusibacillus lacus]GAX91423.1 ribosome biogenesis GTPase YlqF [Effusibacillus lacus]
MAIQWFPGHMAKARREVTEKLKLVDVVYELLDARIPLSSRNPMMNEITQQKPRVVLLNKADLADPEITKEWVAFFDSQGTPAVPIVATEGSGFAKIESEAKRLVAPKLEAMMKKGIRPRAIRAMILGIPNVGKSSLINRMAKRNIAKTGDKPGVTKAQQWIKVGKEFELLDTPGILWPKFEDPEVGLRLAATGAIKDEVLEADKQEISYFLVKWLREQYPGVLENRYKLDILPEEPWDTVLEIGKKRGLVRAGGVIDEEGASNLILREFRAGMLGKISLERP